jgi:hypothetical protein
MADKGTKPLFYVTAEKKAVEMIQSASAVALQAQQIDPSSYNRLLEERGKAALSSLRGIIAGGIDGDLDDNPEQEELEVLRSRILVEKNFTEDDDEQDLDFNPEDEEMNDEDEEEIEEEEIEEEEIEEEDGVDLDDEDMNDEEEEEEEEEEEGTPDETLRKEREELAAEDNEWQNAPLDNKTWMEGWMGEWDEEQLTYQKFLATLARPSPEAGDDSAAFHSGLTEDEDEDDVDFLEEEHVHGRRRYKTNEDGEAVVIIRPRGHSLQGPPMENENYTLTWGNEEDEEDEDEEFRDDVAVRVTEQELSALHRGRRVAADLVRDNATNNNNNNNNNNNPNPLVELFPSTPAPVLTFRERDNIAQLWEQFLQLSAQQCLLSSCVEPELLPRSTQVLSSALDIVNWFQSRRLGILADIEIKCMSEIVALTRHRRWTRSEARNPVAVLSEALRRPFQCLVERGPVCASPLASSLATWLPTTFHQGERTGLICDTAQHCMGQLMPLYRTLRLDMLVVPKAVMVAPGAAEKGNRVGTGTPAFLFSPMEVHLLRVALQRYGCCWSQIMLHLLPCHTADLIARKVRYLRSQDRRMKELPESELEVIEDNYPAFLESQPLPRKRAAPIELNEEQLKRLKLGIAKYSAREPEKIRHKRDGAGTRIRWGELCKEFLPELAEKDAKRFWKVYRRNMRTWAKRSRTSAGKSNSLSERVGTLDGGASDVDSVSSDAYSLTMIQNENYGEDGSSEEDGSSVASEDVDYEEHQVI